jgi:hypothetical protein
MADAHKGWLSQFVYISIKPLMKLHIIYYVTNLTVLNLHDILLGSINPPVPAE